MIDSEFVNMLHEVEDADVSLQECFSSVFELVMSITDSAGNEVELVAGGEGIPVTWENHLEFVALARDMRMKELLLQLQLLKESGKSYQKKC